MVIFNPNPGKLFYFKKTFEGKREGTLILNVNTGTRYKLFMDSALVSCGPQNGKSFDEIDLTDYLKNGENEIIIEVLGNTNNYLYAWGSYKYDNEEIILDTNESWLTAVKPSEINQYGESFTDCKLQFINASEKEEKLKLYKRDISPLKLNMRCLNVIQEKKNVYDAFEVASGYIKVNFRGTGTIKLMYSQCFGEIGNNNEVIKANRADYTQNSTFEDNYDIINCNGEGTWDGFNLRTFRYVTVYTTGNARIDYMYYIESSYPLGASVTYDFHNDLDNKIYEISLRTLKNGIQEEYFDNPCKKEKSLKGTFLQMMFNYNVSNDILLIKHTILNYNQEEIVYSSASRDNSLYFILMVYEYYIRFGEILNISKVKYILDAFNNADLNNEDKLLFKYAREKAEILLNEAGEKYSSLDVETTCSETNFGKALMVLCEISDSFEYTQEFSLENDYFILRALEKCGMYYKRDEILNKYYKFLENNCTTIPEITDNLNECFAPASVVLYEFNAMDLGVKWENNSQNKVIYISPYFKGRNEAKGKVCTAFGDVFVEWKKDIFLELYMPEDIKKIITLPNGNVVETTDSYFIFE